MDNVKEEYIHLHKTAQDADEAFTRLQEIVTILRKECPWDKEQDHMSLRPCMIEEAYEVCDAIDKGDMQNMQEELGDVMLQVLFHSLLAKEEEAFDITDVINGECEKMIRRHPHVFNDKNANTVDKVLERWENIKRDEHKYDTHVDRLKDVPKALPALIRAEKIQKRAAKVGFDWDDSLGAFQKIAEETEELKTACNDQDVDNICEELGDLLFAVVNTARFINVDPEDALNRASEKFIHRFAEMEKLATAAGGDLEDMTLDEMDKLWEEAKKRGN